MQLHSMILVFLNSTLPSQRSIGFLLCLFLLMMCSPELWLCNLYSLTLLIINNTPWYLSPFSHCSVRSYSVFFFFFTHLLHRPSCLQVSSHLASALPLARDRDLLSVFSSHLMRKSPDSSDTYPTLPHCVHVFAPFN